MWKKYFNILNVFVNVSLVLFALWYGIVDKDYAHASFLLLLVMLNENTVKV